MLKNGRFVLSLVALVLLGACSSKPAQQAKNDAEMQALIAEWKQLKPSVQRLVAIESELKILLQALDDLDQDSVERLPLAAETTNIESSVLREVSFEAESPLEVNAQANVAVNTVNTVIDAQKSIAPVEPKSASAQELILKNNQPTRYALQLAAVTKQEAIEPTWLQLKKTYPKLLDGLVLKSEEVMISNRIYYRVKAGEYSSFNEAQKQCDALRQQGASCIVKKGEDA